MDQNPLMKRISRTCFLGRYTILWVIGTQLNQTFTEILQKISP